MEGCDVTVRASIKRRRDCEGLKTDSKSFVWGRSFGAEVFAVCFFPPVNGCRSVPQNASISKSSFSIMQPSIFLEGLRI